MQRRKSAQVNSALPAAAAPPARPPSPSKRALSDRRSSGYLSQRSPHVPRRFSTFILRYKYYSIAVLIFLTLLFRYPSRRGFRGQLYKSHFHDPEHEHGTPSKVYIYDLPEWLSKDMLSLHPSAKHNNSRSDVWVYEQLTSAPFRTYDIEKASLFYIPIFPDIYYESALAEHRNVATALSETAEKYIRPAFDHIRAAYPSWARANGRGHFMTLSHSLGRCAYLPYLQKEEYGDMFFIQHLGALTLYNGDSEVQYALGISQETASQDKFACYRAGWDVLLPPVLLKEVREAENKPSKTKMQERALKSLYRFNPTSDLDPNSYRPNVPALLSNLYEQGKLLHSDWRVDDLVGTFSDMQRTAVCVTPSTSGYTNEMFWVALTAGCIPVSFLNAEDQPFGSYIDYSSFSVNVQPYEANSTQGYIDQILQDRSELRRMQHNLHDAQDTFSWKEQNGLSSLLKKELAERGRKLSRWSAMQAELSQTKCITIEPGWQQCW